MPFPGPSVLSNLSSIECLLIIRPVFCAPIPLCLFHWHTSCGLLSLLACEFSEGSDCHLCIFKISTVSAPNRNSVKHGIELNKKWTTIQQYNILISKRLLVLAWQYSQSRIPRNHQVGLGSLPELCQFLRTTTQGGLGSEMRAGAGKEESSRP